MSEPIKASCQYDDLTGTIAIDGWDHATITSLGIGWPKGYWPVGFTMYAEPTERGGAIEPDIYVLAIDESILDGKPGPDAVRKYAKQHGQLPVFRFRRPKATLAKLLSQIKRLSVTFQDGTTERVPLMLVGDDTSYGDDGEE